MSDIISLELARIHAHLCGDGSVYNYKPSKKGRNNIAVTAYYNNNPKLLDKFRQDFNKVFGVKMYLRPNKEVRVTSLRIFKFLTERFGKFDSYKWRIPESIKQGSEEVKIEWLKAFFEDESYHEKKYNRLKTKSMNLNGLQDAKEILDSLEIFSTLTGPNCDNSYYLTIPKFDSVRIFSGFTKEPARNRNSACRI